MIAVRWFAAVAVLLAAFAGPALGEDMPTVEIDTFWPDLTKLGILLAAFLILAFGMWRVRVGEFIKTLAVWGAILVALLAIYTYRQPLENAGREMVSVLIPGLPVSAGEAVMVRRGFGGHFLLRGEVDGAPVEFIFDTGASTVVLANADAARAGFDVAGLDYRIPVMTAAGMTHVAPVRLGEVAIGDIRITDVRGAVAKAGELDTSLLGMTFLDRLSGFEVRRDRLVLNP
jgi:aspartyl protease family protein